MLKQLLLNKKFVSWKETRDIREEEWSYGNQREKY